MTNWTNLAETLSKTEQDVADAVARFQASNDVLEASKVRLEEARVAMTKALGVTSSQRRPQARPHRSSYTEGRGEQVLAVIAEKGSATAADIAAALGIGSALAHSTLSNLATSGKAIRTAPGVYAIPAPPVQVTEAA